MSSRAAGACRRRRGGPATGLAVAWVCAVLALSGCGGGGDLAGVGSGGTGSGPSPAPPSSAGVGTGGTGVPVVPANATEALDRVPVVAKSLVAGAIDEAGKLVVDGVTIDLGSATVVDGLGDRKTLEDLLPGRVIEAEAVVDRERSTGSASSIRLISQASGTVDAIDPVGGTFTVLRMQVVVSARTLWGPNGGFDALQPGAQVEVWGFREDVGRIAATRVEITRAAEAPSEPAVPVTLRGEVSATSPDTSTLQIGEQPVDVGALVEVPADLTPGTTVQVEGIRAVVDAPIVAQRLEVVPAAPDQSLAVAFVSGVVSRFDSVASFRVGELAIDASGAQWVGATPQEMKDGVTISARGAIVEGRMLAIRIEVDPSTLSSTVPTPPVETPASQ